MVTYFLFFLLFLHLNQMVILVALGSLSARSKYIAETIER